MKPLARLLTLGAIAGASAVVFAAPASAATSVSVTDGSGSHVGGSTVDHDTVLTISASVPKGASYTISAAGPQSCQVASGATRSSLTGGTTTVSGDFDTTSPPNGCGDQGIADDGTWTFTVNVSPRSGSPSSGSQQVTLAIPPDAVQGVTAATTGSQSAAITWQPDRTPQIAEYRVYDNGTQVAAGLAPAAVCSGSSCGVSATNQSYGTHSYSVRAYRSCSGCGGPVASPDSDASTVTFTPPPSPSAAGAGGTAGTGTGASAPTGSSTGTTTGHPGVTSPGKRLGTKRGRLSVGNAISRFVPAPNILPPPDEPSTIVEQGPLGTYKPRLAYPDQTIRLSTTKPGAAHGGLATTVFRHINPKVWEGLAAMLLFVLVAGHLRAWLGRSTPT